MAEDRDAARECVRVLVAFYIPAMPVEQVQRHGIDVAQTQPIFDAFASGDVERAIELTTPDLVEKLSFSGTPEDVVEQIQANVVPAGMNHVILSLCDPTLARALARPPGRLRRRPAHEGPAAADPRPRDAAAHIVLTRPPSIT